MPQRLKYSAVQGANGVDLFGNAILYYDQFQVSLLVSKAVHSTQASEIYLDNEVIAIQDITRIRTVSLANSQGQTAVISQYQPKHDMVGELEAFGQVLRGYRGLEEKSPANELYRHWTLLSYQVAQVMQAMRQSAQLAFPFEGEAYQESEVSL